MGIRQILDISTGHLDAASKDWLTAQAADTSVMEGCYGWFTPVYDQPAQHPDTVRHPDVLEAIFVRARELGCDAVMFDADALHDETLPTFDDEGDEAPCDAEQEEF